jgi:ABC-2 type transport system ATP-binding protein
VNIDPEGVREILELVRGLREREGTTVLISSHLLHQVEQICDRVGIFVQGRLAALGTVEDLVAEAQGGYSIDIELDGAGEDDARSVLQGVEGVTTVEPSLGGWLVCSDRDVRSPVVDSCRAAGFAITRLVGGITDLDAVYHTYFAGERFGGSHGDDHS